MYAATPAEVNHLDRSEWLIEHTHTECVRRFFFTVAYENGGEDLRMMSRAQKNYV